MNRTKPAGAPYLEQHRPGYRMRAQIAEQASEGNIPIAAILPAYNESGRISSLLAVLRNVSLIREIIVVDDGSQDATAEEAYQAAALDARIRVLRHERNLGKGAAMLNGSRQTSAPIVLFLDSDLIGLTPSHIEALIKPVASGQADMSIGVFKHGHFVTDLSQRVTPWLSGQRCLKQHLLYQVGSRAAAGYGVETAITIAARHGQWRVASVPLSGVSHPTGEIHRGLLRGVANRLRMYTHILQAAWLAGAPVFQFAVLTPRVRLISIIMTIIFAVTLAFNQAQALALIQLEDLVSINIEGVFKILVIDQKTTHIPDLLTAESSNQKLLDLPELDLSPLKLPQLDLPLLDQLPNRANKPELIQAVALSLDIGQLDGADNQLKLRLTGDPDPITTYRLLVVTSSGATQTYPLTPRVLGHGPKPAAVSIDLTAYENPFLIGFAIEAELQDETQRSGWTLILFPEWIP